MTTQNKAQRLILDFLLPLDGCTTVIGMDNRCSEVEQGAEEQFVRVEKALFIVAEGGVGERTKDFEAG